MNKAFKIITNSLLILVILVLLLYLVLKLTNTAGIYKVMTGSMETGIHSGDYILVKKSSNYKKGDVITYMKDGNYITHRIVKIENNKIITKGDANNVEDEAIEKEDIVGKYIFKSKIMNFIIDNKYYIAAIIILLYVASIIFDKYKKEQIEVV